MKTLKESLCACALVLCAWTAVPAHAQTNATLGNVDGVVGDGTGAVTLRGWACWVGYVIHPYSPQIKLYAGGEAGKGGVELGTYQVDQPSEQAVQDICKNQNPNNRFAIGISIAVRQQYGGQRLYIYAETLGAPTNSYTLLPGSGQYTVPVAPAVTDSVYYIHTDRLGSNVIMTDANANVVAETEYKAYGAAADSNQKSEAPGYTGQYEDPLTGLTYMQQRYYDADLGRFISVDPVAARSGDVFNFNRYAYAANSPLNFVDPTGMDWCQAQVNGVNAGIGYCGDSGAPTIYGSSGQGGGANGGPYGGGGGGSIPTEKPVNVTANRPADDPTTLSPMYVAANRAPEQSGPQNNCSRNWSHYWNDYANFVDQYAVNLGPYAVAMVGGVMPKRWAPAYGFRGPLLGSSNPLTSVPRGFGIPGAGSAIPRLGFASIGLVTVGIGMYDATIELEGFVYAIPSQGSTCK